MDPKNKKGCKRPRLPLKQIEFFSLGESKYFKKLLAGLCLLIFLLCVPISASDAHRMIIIERENSGTLQILYEGGIPARRAFITLFDEQGDIIKEGPADKNGMFFFEPLPEIRSAQASDGLGHLADYVFHENVRREIPLFVRAFLGVTLLLILAYVSRVIRAKRSL